MEWKQTDGRTRQIALRSSLTRSTTAEEVRNVVNKESEIIAVLVI